MATVFIPPQMRELTDGEQEVEISAANIRGVIVELDSRFPGIADRLRKDDELKPGLSVSIDGRISSLGLLQKVPPEAEVHFIPAVGGG